MPIIFYPHTWPGFLISRTKLPSGRCCSNLPQIDALKGQASDKNRSNTAPRIDLILQRLALPQIFSPISRYALGEDLKRRDRRPRTRFTGLVLLEVMMHRNLSGTYVSSPGIDRKGFRENS